MSNEIWKDWSVWFAEDETRRFEEMPADYLDKGDPCSLRGQGIAFYAPDRATARMLAVSMPLDRYGTYDREAEMYYRGWLAAQQSAPAPADPTLATMIADEVARQFAERDAASVRSLNAPPTPSDPPGDDDDNDDDDEEYTPPTETPYQRLQRVQNDYAHALFVAQHNRLPSIHELDEFKARIDAVTIAMEPAQPASAPREHDWRTWPVWCVHHNSDRVVNRGVPELHRLAQPTHIAEKGLYFRAIDGVEAYGIARRFPADAQGRFTATAEAYYRGWLETTTAIMPIYDAAQAVVETWRAETPGGDLVVVGVAIEALRRTMDR